MSRKCPQSSHHGLDGKMNKLKRKEKKEPSTPLYQAHVSNKFKITLNSPLSYSKVKTTAAILQLKREIKPSP